MYLPATSVSDSELAILEYWTACFMIGHWSAIARRAGACFTTLDTGRRDRKGHCRAFITLSIKYMMNTSDVEDIDLWLTSLFTNRNINIEVYI